MTHFELGGVTEPTEVIELEEGDNWIVRRGVGWLHQLNLTLSDTQISNNQDSVTASITVVDGLEVARGANPTDATVLDYDGDVTISIDGVETTKTLTDGSVSFDLTTEKPAGSTIGIVAESLADHPAESDRAEIEVISS